MESPVSASSLYSFSLTVSIAEYLLNGVDRGVHGACPDLRRLVELPPDEQLDGGCREALDARHDLEPLQLDSSFFSALPPPMICTAIW